MAPALDLSQWNTVTDWDAVRESCEAVKVMKVEEARAA